MDSQTWAVLGAVGVGLAGIGGAVLAFSKQLFDWLRRRLDADRDDFGKERAEERGRADEERRRLDALIRQALDDARTLNASLLQQLTDERATRQAGDANLLAALAAHTAKLLAALEDRRLSGMRHAVERAAPPPLPAPPRKSYPGEPHPEEETTADERPQARRRGGGADASENRYALTREEADRVVPDEPRRQR